MEVAAIMKRVMNIRELKRYCEDRSLRRILFCSENQSWGSVDDPMKVNMVFTSMLMACNPNVICLKDGDNTLHFEKVKNVYLDQERSAIGTVLDIVCGDSNTKEKDIKYTIIIM